MNKFIAIYVGSLIKRINYLDYFFDIKQSRAIATREVVLPFDELTAELVHPKRAENRARTQVATTLAS